MKHIFVFRVEDKASPYDETLHRHLSDDIYKTLIPASVPSKSS